VRDEARREYAEELRGRYALASRKEKGRILDEYCRTTHVHRKAAIRTLRRTRAAGGRRPGRPRRYTAALSPVLAELWELSGRLSGKLLVPVLPLLLPALERHRGPRLGPAQRALVLGLSAATLDRLLRPVRQRHGRLPRRASLAATALKQQIPIRTWSEWAGVRPGEVQGDLVLHCGESTAGFYLATLLAIDVATGWTELEPVWGLHADRVGSAVHHVRARLPMPLIAWHSDNGSEFINDGLYGWCRRHDIAFTRGRPYRKNDQAYVEQRNGLAVRRIVGHDRYSSRPAFATLQRLYPLLRLHLNFFRPLRKLVSKTRVGSKVIKRYDTAQTPYQRLLATGGLPAARQQALAAQLAALDPVTLALDVQRTLTTLWALRDNPRRLHPAQSG
jgi:transposase InsO family protein